MKKRGLNSQSAEETFLKPNLATIARSFNVTINTHFIFLNGNIAAIIVLDPIP